MDQTEAMRAGLRSRVARLARRAGGYAPPVLLAALAAGTLAPLVNQGLGVAAIGAVAAVGGNVLTDIVKAAVGRLRPGEDVEPAIEAALQEALTSADSAALRSEIAGVLREVGAVTVALDAAGDDIREDLATGFADLGGRFTEFAFLRTELREALDDLQVGLDRQGAAQQVIIDLLHRQSTEVRLVRSVLDRRVAETGELSRWPGPPYRGLQHFTEDQAEVFHGRERMVADLTGLLSRYDCGLFVVTGPSGVGKSSLVQAGLLPALAQEWPDRPRRVIMPGLTRLAVTLATMMAVDAVTVLDRLSERPETAGVLCDQAAGGRLVLVVDQFEQIFQTGEAEAFVTALAAMNATVIVTVRADFIDRCAAHACLIEALRERQFIVGPMRPDELRRAITGPADAAGLEIEPGLTDTILAELSGPGALPLLSQAMLTTWGHREGNRLTARGYALSGGVAKAVETSAEGVYTALTLEQQVNARKLFTALTGVADDSRLVRRAIDGPADAVAEAFAQRRLLVVGDVIQISHDVLLTTWPRLHGWLKEDLTGHRLRSQFLDDARDWHDQGRDPSFLYRGARLAVVRRAAGSWTLMPPAIDYLRAANRAAARGGRIRRGVAAGLVLLLIVAVAAAGMAISAAGEADHQSRLAITGERVASARLLNTQASSVRLTDPMASLGLALAAYQLNPGSESRAELTAVLSGPFLGELDTGAALSGAAVSSGGQLLITAVESHGIDSGGFQIWDIVDPFHPRLLTQQHEGYTAGVLGVAIDPTGGVVATGARDGRVLLWDIRDPRQPRRYPTVITSPSLPEVVAFSPDGTTLAVGGDQLVFYDVREPGDPRLRKGSFIPRGDPDVISGVHSPDGARFAAGYDDGTVIVWDLSSRRGHTVTGKGSAVSSIDYSDDGRMIAVNREDSWVTLWDVTDTARPRQLGEPLASRGGLTTSVAFSPSADLLAVDGADGMVTLWDITNPARPVARTPGLPAGQSLGAMLFRGDGALLVTATPGGTIHFWDPTGAPGPRVLGGPLSSTIGTIREGVNGLPANVAFSPEGRFIAVSQGDHVMLLDAITRLPVGEALDGDHGSLVREVHFSPDGRVLVTGSTDRLVVWDLTVPAKPVRKGEPLTSDLDFTFVAFMPQIGLVAGAGTDTVMAWNVNGAVPREISPPRDLGGSSLFGPDGWLRGSVLLNSFSLLRAQGSAEPVFGARTKVTFSLDGRLMAVGHQEVLISIWDITNPAGPRLLGEPQTGARKSVEVLAISPNNLMLVSVDGDHRLVVRDLTNPVLSHVLAGPVALTGEPFSAVFSPDGSTLALAYRDQGVRLWDFSALLAIHRDPVTRACAIARDGLSRSDWARYVALPYEKSCP
ncbi:nSTAND1 domain-containing NTPase [Herbidospora mongoliensis]|uniref:nSTAND1 domain-containing NTPase n=1 Tax=Herbidospora mongoliensis TaxID=688067 RepID=UPI000832D365|nr:hypothetical protein [Herbidospora mongoliensis]